MPCLSVEDSIRSALIYKSLPESLDHQQHAFLIFSGQLLTSGQTDCDDSYWAAVTYIQITRFVLGVGLRSFWVIARGKILFHRQPLPSICHHLGWSLPQNSSRQLRRYVEDTKSISYLQFKHFFVLSFDRAQKLTWPSSFAISREMAIGPPVMYRARYFKTCSALLSGIGGPSMKTTQSINYNLLRVAFNSSVSITFGLPAFVVVLYQQ